MTAPTAYTEKSLAEYMCAQLGDLSTILALTVGTADAGSLNEALNTTLLAYGVSDISAALDIAKLRALARVQAWQLAVDRLTALYDFSVDGGSYQRAQMVTQARFNLAAARLDALIYDPGYTVTTTRQGHR